MVLSLALMAVSGIAGMAAEEERDAFLYAGMNSCRMCCKKDSTGNEAKK